MKCVKIGDVMEVVRDHKFDRAVDEKGRPRSLETATPRNGIMSYRDIGERLGVSGVTVRKHHDIAVDKLRKGLWAMVQSGELRLPRGVLRPAARLAGWTIDQECEHDGG